MSKTAVILFNLGGPNSQAAVRPFLFNLFYDPAIIRLPNPFRYLLARLITRLRAEKSRNIYALIGGASPIYKMTLAQAAALQEELGGTDNEFRTFVSMRYWHPFSAEIVRQVKEYRPDEIILLPLYPQFSTTTTGSSLANWAKEAEKQGLVCTTKSICCYYTESDFIEAHVNLIRAAYADALKASPGTRPRIIFSAHGLPEAIIHSGDPYQFHTEETVKAIMKRLAELGGGAENFDFTLCYQSRVGLMKWLGPTLEETIKKAAMDAVPVIIVPVSFVSEHSETLTELDIQYKTLAENLNIPGYHRVPALFLEKNFIKSLANLVHRAKEQGKGICSYKNRRVCPDEFVGCPNR